MFPNLPESYEPKVLCSYGFDVVAEWCRFSGIYLTRSLCSQGSMFLGPMFPGSFVTSVGSQEPMFPGSSVSLFVRALIPPLRFDPFQVKIYIYFNTKKIILSS